MTITELIKTIKSCVYCEEYISVKGNKCYKTVGTLYWYYTLCYKCGLQVNWIDDFTYEAYGDGFELNYVENDVILVIKETKMTDDDIANTIMEINNIDNDILDEEDIIEIIQENS